MKILVIGDVYGKPGRRIVRSILSKIKKEHNVDWVIANGENATNGAGIMPKHRDNLLESGVDLITSGNHLFSRVDWHKMISESTQVLRPHNIGCDKLPGKGFSILEGPEKPPLAVVNLSGRVFMDPAESPFQWADILLSRLPPSIPVLVDFHAEATSEKIALAWYLEGRVSFVAGTHTHVQTSDERILPKGTGAISDIGMTGPRDGVLGVSSSIILDRFVNGYSDRFEAAQGPGVMEGVLVEIAPNGQTNSVEGAGPGFA
ncbi:YmdB family metallophosphoesterase [bacterium]|nr:YmdB family metallophosphoesterase [bacterium]